MKTKTITVSGGHAPSQPSNTYLSEEAWKTALRFKVERLTDSLDYHVGELLERGEVQQLCDSSHWKVTIVAPKV